MALTEDFACYFVDFGIDATVGGVTVRGIFDAAYSDGLGISGTQPVLLVASSVTAADGTAITIGATAYVVTDVQPDGTGMTRLMLQESA